MTQYGVSFAAKLIEKGEFVEAIGAADKAIALAEEDSEPRFERALALAGMGQYLDAATDFEQAIALEVSSQMLDTDILDDSYFDALLSAARGESNIADGVKHLERYAKTLPEGRHAQDSIDWAKRLRGELKSEFVKRSLDD